MQSPGKQHGAPEPGRGFHETQQLRSKSVKSTCVWTVTTAAFTTALRGGSNPKHPPTDDWILKRQCVQTEILLPAIKIGTDTQATLWMNL